MFPTARKLIGATVELAFGLLLLKLGYEALVSPAAASPDMWTLIGGGLLLGGAVVVFFTVRRFRAIFEIDLGLRLPRLCPFTLSG
jgi:hypothetical protein